MDDSDTDTADAPEQETVTRDEVDDIIDQALDAAEERTGDLPDDDEMRSIVEDVLESQTDATSEPHLNPDAGDVSAGEKRAATEDGCLHLTSKLYRAILQQNQQRQREVQRDLFEAGHYDDLVESEELRAEGFQTLIDEKGGVFIPTTVASRIYDIEDQVGAVTQVATELPLDTGERMTVPNVLGTITFSAGHL